MLNDLTIHYKHVLKQSTLNWQENVRTGALDLETQAREAAIHDINDSSVDAALACLQREFNQARLALKARATISDADANFAIIELDEIAVSLRLLVDGLMCMNGKLNDEGEVE